MWPTCSCIIQEASVESREREGRERERGLHVAKIKDGQEICLLSTDILFLCTLFWQLVSLTLEVTKGLGPAPPREIERDSQAICIHLTELGAGLTCTQVKGN